MCPRRTEHERNVPAKKAVGQQDYFQVTPRSEFDPGERGGNLIDGSSTFAEVGVLGVLCHSRRVVFGCGVHERWGFEQPGRQARCLQLAKHTRNFLLAEIHAVMITNRIWSSRSSGGSARSEPLDVSLVERNNDLSDLDLRQLYHKLKAANAIYEQSVAQVLEEAIRCVSVLSVQSRSLRLVLVVRDATWGGGGSQERPDLHRIRSSNVAKLRERCFASGMPGAVSCGISTFRRVRRGFMQYSHIS